MRSYRLLHSLLLVPAIAACGDDGGSNTPDAFIITGDAMPDTPPPPPGCDYGELNDATNDDATSAGQPEQSMVMFSGSAVFCGKLNIARYDTTTNKVDADAYTFTLTGDTELYISMYGAGLAGIAQVDLQIYGGQGFQSLVTSGSFAGNHAAAITVLEAGTYEIYVRAYNNGAPAADVDYKVKLSTDDLEARCVPVTTGGFAEAGDGANNLGNDMVGIDFDATDPDMFQILTTANDVPENTALTIADAMSYRFTGTGQVTNPIVGSYRDRDTFEITTGAMTNEITIRTAWPTATADLDMFVFEKPPAGAMTPIELGSAAFTGVGPNEEVITIAVDPNTKYWVWIGNYSDSTGAGVYSSTICGVNYTPPN
jgi:hypothetical protein